MVAQEAEALGRIQIEAIRVTISVLIESETLTKERPSDRDTRDRISLQQILHAVHIGADWTVLQPVMPPGERTVDQPRRSHSSVVPDGKVASPVLQLVFTGGVGNFVRVIRSSVRPRGIAKER